MFKDKKSKHQGGIRGFHVSHKAWYRGTIVKPQITIGVYHYNEDGEDDGTTGEFCIKWDKLGKDVVPCLRLYDDSWSLLMEFQDFFTALAAMDDKHPTPEQIEALLQMLKFKDLTAYKQE